MTPTHDARTAGLREAVATPEMIAAAWDVWKPRSHHYTTPRLGPGPAFRDAIEAALRVAMASGPIAAHIASVDAERDTAEIERDTAIFRIREAEETAAKSSGCALDAEAEVARLTARMAEMRSALKAVHGLVTEAPMTGFNYQDGDWAERLFRSQGTTMSAITTVDPGYRAARTAIRQKDADHA